MQGCICYVGSYVFIRAQCLNFGSLSTSGKLLKFVMNWLLYITVGSGSGQRNNAHLCYR